MCQKAKALVRVSGSDARKLNSKPALPEASTPSTATLATSPVSALILTWRGHKAVQDKADHDQGFCNAVDQKKIVLSCTDSRCTAPGFNQTVVSALDQICPVSRAGQSTTTSMSSIVTTTTRPVVPTTPPNGTIPVPWSPNSTSPWSPYATAGSTERFRRRWNEAVLWFMILYGGIFFTNFL